MQNAADALSDVQGFGEMSVVVISGPTCSGKTAFAIKTALETSAEIISCDSVQLYRGLDIGSAKPTAAERAQVRHHLIDVADVRDCFDVAGYVELAKAAFDDIRARGKNVVVVGGSGFYLKSWFCAVADKIEVPEDVRAFAQEAESRGAEALAEELLKISPDARNLVDLHNPRRTRNALERCMATGKSVGELRAEFAKLPCPYGEFEKRFIILDRPDAEMLARISERTRAMVAAGLVEETRRLLAEGLDGNPSVRNSTGYKQAADYIKNGGCDTRKLAEEIDIQTMSLVRKQRKILRAMGAQFGAVRLGNF